MPRRLLLGLFVLLPLSAASALLATGAQSPTPPPVLPAKHVELAAAPTVKGRDLAKLTPQQRLCYMGAYRGTEWLRRTNKQDGKFVYGFLPDLRVTLNGDSFTAQAGAAFALARAARFFGDEAGVAVSRQALLTLLLETAVDPKDKEIRHMAAPARMVNRLASQGELVLAIHELPSPGKDLLDQGDQLCNHLRKQQQSTGAFVVTEAGDDVKFATRDDALACAGLALHGLVRSQKLRPAPWKLEAATKARGFALSCWQQKKSLPFAVAQTPAFAEAYLLTQDKAYAELVFAMNDWLCTLQYAPTDAVRPDWVGGFRPWIDGQAATAAPDIRSAEAAECLAEACRAARAAADLPRLMRYRRALENCLQFVLTLQYSENQVQHFVEAYRPAVLGAFHPSPQDGKIRIDFAQHALSALVMYLEQAAD
jgi:hypothetical protein